MVGRRSLRELLEAAGLDIEVSRDVQVSGVFDNSQRVEGGGVFVATRGTKTDSHLFISDAVERGAAVLVVEQDIPKYRNAVILKVENSREVLGKLAHAWHGNPTREMLVIGVSGTNGKTTTTYLLESIFREAGLSPGVIGTIEYRYADQKVKATNTTPTAMQLAELMADMLKAGVQAVAMEVSSHAVDQERVAGIEFDVGILTNITQDHLDYHKTMEAYAEAKKRFYFDLLLQPKRGTAKLVPTAVFNIDDAYAAGFATEFPGRKITVGNVAGADIRVERSEFVDGETVIHAASADGPVTIFTPLLGAFNIQNVIGAYAAGQAANFDKSVILAGLRNSGSVAGRFEQVTEGQDFHVIVDYAHTPDALERVLVNARGMTTKRIICVFGCGGDRDPGKRPIMGRIAAELSDIAIITNDNPRTENPESIAEMVRQGVLQCETGAMQQCITELDRRDAIGKAISLAKEGDLVIIAGKGHEDYQILNTGTIHFDDREVARESLHLRLNVQK